MSNVYRLVSILLFATTTLFAQDFRVTSDARAVQIRVQVLYASGTSLFDSDWKNGNILDVNALPYGSYQILISSRDVDGKVTEKRTTLQVAPDRVSIDPALPDDLKLTTTAHDGTTGQIITTSGDLSFRFGDYLNKKDTEAMRLSPEGNLEVKGWIKAGQGIVFPDGSTVDTKNKLKAKADTAGSGTQNQISKWIDNAGTLGDSTVSEVSGNVGIGTFTPSGKLHIFGTATQDVFAGMGTDMLAGPAFNFGYGGASFGRSAGFFNVRPDASAVAPNPSLRFLTGNVERMIVTNTGNVGIGTSTPGGKLQVYSAAAADVFAGFGTDMSAGPSFNFGYGGATFGRGAGFLNARPDASAVAPNPSLRFMTNNVERMIVTNAGYVGIGTSAPTEKLDINGNLALPLTTSAALGVVLSGGTPFLHNLGFGNTFLGLNAGNFTMGSGSNYNTGIGYLALNLISSGFANTGVGFRALNSNVTSNYNTAIGEESLRFADGPSNTGVGFQTLWNNTTGSGNIAVGASAGFNLTTGNSNIVIGNSGVAAESGTIRIGTGQSRAFLAGVRGVTPAATDGQGVLIDSNGQLGTIGDVTFSNNLHLPATTFNGTAGVVTVGGNRFISSYGNGPYNGTNTFVGQNAGNTTTIGIRNVGIGQQALASLGNNGQVNANDNVAVGSLALTSLTFGNLNTAVGRVAGINLTTGSGNIAIGVAGQNIVTGNNNIDIGNAGVGDESNTTRIGTNGTQTRAFMAGIRDVTTGAQDAVPVLIDSTGQFGTISSSVRYKFDIADMSDRTNKLMNLRPVTFRYRQFGDRATLQYGLIAEEVATIYPELVVRNKDGQPETVMYQFLAPMLLNQAQKQERKIADQQKTIDRLLERLDALEKQIAKK